MRSASFQNRVFGGITRKKILFFWIFLILSAARLVAPVSGEIAGVHIPGFSGLRPRYTLLTALPGPAFRR
jgi:hypothetical protein